jgi:hypothetical protein
VNTIYIGHNSASFTANEVKGQLVRFDNDSYYKISNCNAMRPFFMSIVSDSDHWLFISSNGGLTAGRKDSESALFPYYTDDKIAESAAVTGSKTILQIHAQGKTFLWEPFSERHSRIYKIQRNLYKNSYGNKVVFEEINYDLGVSYRYQWCSSERYGFVKKSTLVNNTKNRIEVTALDGIQNILPHGVPSGLQNRQSNLVDAYKKNELEAQIGLGIYALSAIIVDRAEPSEALKATTVWSAGIENAKYLVSSLQLDAFMEGKEIEQEIDIRAEKGAYFLCTDINLAPEKEKSWIIVAEVNQSIIDINEISKKIKTEKNLFNLVQEDIERGTKRLLELNGAADGLQLTADKLKNIRHFSNSLFNIMRGGIFDDNYEIDKSDFIKYLENANRDVRKNKRDLLAQLPQHYTLEQLRELAHNDEDSNFKRLAFEYLPLKFSRRHGDPSRPWNKFSINTKNGDGSKILDYEGNWRDIFQNWEALAHSYPLFMESMIHKFLNATTFEGYNPYRVTKDGFEWETIEPDNPWSYIGYWGDHQIIYLLKFLEFMEKHHPNTLSSYFDQEIFVYADVPYRIKDYTEILKNPKDTIVLDTEAERKIIRERELLGADGALLRDKNSVIYKVNLIEKLLATVLAKISNFIPEGGIWMNTQRPEWNDANNALVGNGVSMVTLYYLRRFINFFEHIVQDSSLHNNLLSMELVTFFDAISRTLIDNVQILSGKVSDKDRKIVLDRLGIAGSEYRSTIYENGFSSGRGPISKKDLLKFLSISKQYLDHSIKANKREDKLYHAYNLMTVESNSEVSISYLPEMLEGQVAVLSSGYISSKASLELLDALKGSALFRPDQNSYILYPNKQLPRFIEKNTIPSSKVESSQLLRLLLKNGNGSIVEKDVYGKYHFNGNFNNVDSLKNALLCLPKDIYGKLIEKDTPLLVSIFEEIFEHKSFTGRSGTFFGYEGLGSIYWHMVSKLLLSVQETCLKAMECSEDKVVVGGLLDHYYEINDGIGIHKSPELYGAFPTDPYSHTPSGKGAQQPGMTGQVKEDILSRFGELGVFVAGGRLSFNPILLRKEEFVRSPKTFTYITVNNEVKEILLEKDSLCFTYCQIPIIYKLSKEEGIEVIFNDDSIIGFDDFTLGSQTTKKVFERSGEINRIRVHVKM